MKLGRVTKRILTSSKIEMAPETWRGVCGGTPTGTEGQAKNTKTRKTGSGISQSGE